MKFRRLFKAGMPRTAPAHLPAVLVLGAVSQMGQVLFLRELLMVFQGNELFIGLILAAWLVWVGAGSRLGALLVDRLGRPLFLLALNAAGVLVVLPAVILFMRGLRGILNVHPGAYLSLLDVVLSCLLLLALPCLLLGAQFVLLSRVWRESDRAADTSGAGKTYVGEAAGSVLGGIFFTFFVVHYWNSFQAAVFAGGLMLAAVLYTTWKYTGNTAGAPVKTRPLLLLLLALAATSFPFLGQVDAWAYKMQWRYFAPQHLLVETHQSEYGNIAVLQREEQYSFYQSGHLMFSIAGPEAPAPALEEQEAVDFAHLSMVQHEKPSRVLLIGGGLRGMLGEMLKHPVGRVDYLELDEVLIGAARPHLPAATLKALADPRVHLKHIDGRLFVKAAEKQYDMIIVDAPDPATAALNRYYTEEFFREAAALLCPGGVFVIGADSTPDLRGAAVANRNATIYHTLSAVFSRVLPAGERFMFFFATNAPGQISVDPLILEERYGERDIEAEGFSPHHYHTLLEESQMQRVNWVVRNHGRSPDAHLAGPGTGPLVPGTVAEQEEAESELPPVERRYFINSDFKPIGYFYTLMYMDELARAGYREFFHRLLHIEFWWLPLLFCFPLAAVPALQAAARRGKERLDIRFGVLFTVFTTGFSTMALQIALLFSFQSIYGFVYEMVGLIVAIFMCGLALGAYMTNRYVRHKANINTLAAVQLVIAALAAGIALALPQVAGVQFPAAIFALFSMLTFTAGLINGVDFPLSAACYMALRGNPEKTTGAVYGTELFGACVGATLASAVVVPILGIAACCLIAGAANGTAFVVLLLSRRSYHD